MSQIFSATDRWALLRRFVTSGIFTSGITKEARDKLTLVGFDSCFPIPAKRMQSDSSQFEKVISTFRSQSTEEGKALIRKAMLSIQVIHLEDLVRNVKKITSDINQLTHEDKHLSVLTYQDKSNEWLAHLSAPFLQRISARVPIVFTQNDKNNAVYLEALQGSENGALLIIDDSAYSGKQQAQIMKQNFLPVLSQLEPGKYHLIFASAFATDPAFEYLNEVKQELIDAAKWHGVTLTVDVIRADKIPTVTEAVEQKFPDTSEEELSTLDDIFDEAPYLTVTDWKVPDHFSFPEKFAPLFSNEPPVYKGWRPEASQYPWRRSFDLIEKAEMNPAISGQEKIALYSLFYKLLWGPTQELNLILDIKSVDERLGNTKLNHSERKILLTYRETLVQARESLTASINQIDSPLFFDHSNTSSDYQKACGALFTEGIIALNLVGSSPDKVFLKEYQQFMLQPDKEKKIEDWVSRAKNQKVIESVAPEQKNQDTIKHPNTR